MFTSASVLNLVQKVELCKKNASESMLHLNLTAFYITDKQAIRDLKENPGHQTDNFFQNKVVSNLTPYRGVIVTYVLGLLCRGGLIMAWDYVLGIFRTQKIY